MDLTLAGLIGAFVGLAVGWASAMFVIGIVERKLRALDKSASPTERAAFETRLVLMRRIVLGIEVVVFTSVGYWLGHVIGG